MHFVVLCRDKPGHQEVRLANRPAHLDWLKAHPEIVVAGPFLSDDGQAMTGSMLIVEAETQATVEAMLPADPYAKAGLFEAVEVRPWRWAVGKPA